MRDGEDVRNNEELEIEEEEIKVTRSVLTDGEWKEVSLSETEERDQGYTTRNIYIEEEEWEEYILPQDHGNGINGDSPPSYEEVSGGPPPSYEEISDDSPPSYQYEEFFPYAASNNALRYAMPRLFGILSASGIDQKNIHKILEQVSPIIDEALKRDSIEYGAKANGQAVAVTVRDSYRDDKAGIGKIAETPDYSVYKTEKTDPQFKESAMDKAHDIAQSIAAGVVESSVRSNDHVEALKSRGGNENNGRGM
jgi:hypothetical protein